jgi:hypothetical protein
VSTHYQALTPTCFHQLRQAARAPRQEATSSEGSFNWSQLADAAIAAGPCSYSRHVEKSGLRLRIEGKLKWLGLPHELTFLNEDY